ncbi:hypothetical protein [Candidatus Hodarchaeum mangrovi]
MGKDEKVLTEILEKISSLEDKLTNMEFLLVQGMGSGGSLPKPISSSAPNVAVGPVEVDFAPIEGRLGIMEKNISELTLKVNTLSEITSNIRSEKAEKADELIAQATTLLEKGLQLTELETTLLELKDKLEEIVIQLEVSNVGSTDDIS